MPEPTKGPWAPMGNPHLMPEELWTPNRGALEVSPGLTIGSIHHTEPICRVFGYLLPVVANARLISAAPDMLEALEWAHVQLCPHPQWCESNHPVLKPRHDTIRAAIAKAKGETS